MTDIEKFEGFKEKMIDENEKNYGTEIREKYGKDIIDTSNKKLKNMSKQDYENWQNLNIEIISKLKKLLKLVMPLVNWLRKLQNYIING